MLDITDLKRVFHPLVSEVAPYGYSWKQWEAITEIARHADFGCRFDEDGVCNGGRPTSDGRNCCKDCAERIGWFGDFHYLQGKQQQTETINVNFLPTIFSRWDNKLGFWRKEGCALSHGMRSPTCLRYYCPGTMKTQDHKNCIEILWSILDGDYLIPNNDGGRDIPPQLTEVEQKLKQIGAWS